MDAGFVPVAEHWVAQQEVGDSLATKVVAGLVQVVGFAV